MSPASQEKADLGGPEEKNDTAYQNKPEVYVK